MDEASYRDMSEEALADLYATAGDEDARAIRAEMARRDTRDAKHATDAARWAATTAAWMDWQHAQYLAADSVCRGNLLSREGIAAGATEFSLWTGSQEDADRYASEELRDFWAGNPRLTVSQFHRQARAERRAAREAAERHAAQAGE
jgi:hypothetical protein